MSFTSRSPSEGIVASVRPHGWAAKSWLSIFEPLKKSHHAQLARGRALARGGKVRELWFSPGMVGAIVADGREEHQVRLKVVPFEDEQWDQVTTRLLERIGRIAALFEGELPEDLLELLAKDGVSPLPKRREIEGTCDCEDFRLPCRHMAAVHNLIADALDGDPFLLLTLRGLDRDQLIVRLRRAWGDPVPLIARRPDIEAPPPDTALSWLDSPEALPTSRITLPQQLEKLTGVLALGPPPGGEELISAIGPLYVAGAERAAEIIYDKSRAASRGATDGWQGFRRGASPPSALREALETRTTTRLSKTEADRIRAIVNHLAIHGPTSTAVIADLLGEPRAAVRSQLEALCTLGMLYRTGRTRGVRWILG